MASLPNTKPVTYDQWLRMPEIKDEEVVDGEIRIMPAAKWNHALIIMNMADALRRGLDRKSHIVVTGSWGLVIRTAPLVCRTPDLAVFERAKVVEVDGYVRSAPQLAVEVLSPRNTPKDMRLKIAEYGGLGLPELWVVSQENRTIEVFLLEDGQLARKAVISGGTLRPTCLPEAAIDIAAIWPE